MPPTATTDWLPGFTPVDVGPHGGTWADANAPWRITLHSTESGSSKPALDVYRKKGIPPHATVDPARRERLQHVSLNRSCYALENDPGGVETNRVRNIQVEIVGYAAQMHLLSEDVKRWLGQEVLRPILTAIPSIRLWSPPFYGQDAGFTLATEHARQRMTADGWLGFDGVCGHQHVPENAHWDPGALDVAGILNYARPTTPEEAVAMGYVQAEIHLGSKAKPLPNGRWPFYAVKANGQVDVLNDVSALDGHSDIWFGDARSLALPAPVTAFAQTPGGKGYYLVTADGGVFTYGNAKFYGSQGGKPLAAPVIGISLAASSTGVVTGYVLLSADGGCFNFGTVA